MDEVTPRTRSTSRRMASAKGGATTRRRSSSSRSPKKDQEPEVSPARWGGVALVIAAIVGAIFLAAISPSESAPEGQPGLEVAQSTAEPAASPSSTELDVAIPVSAPEIVLPKDGEVIGEFEIAVTVDVPDDRTVPRRELDLHVYNGSQLAKTAANPKPGTTVKVEGIRLAPGVNTLTAVLGSPAGPGPTSEPSTIVLDENKPVLTIVSPKNKFQTYDDAVLVEVTSEVDASVTIRNQANDHDPEVTIGPSGAASELIRLRRGKNKIVATSVDAAGLEHEKSVTVTRLDGRPTVKLKAPGSVDPPETVRIVAEVTDGKKDPMPDAEVHFTLTAPNQSTLSEPSVTNAKGRAVWEVQVPSSSSPADALELGVTVISPSGDQTTKIQTIGLK